MRAGRSKKRENTNRNKIIYRLQLQCAAPKLFCCWKTSVYFCRLLETACQFRRFQCPHVWGAASINKYYFVPPQWKGKQVRQSWNKKRSRCDMIPNTLDRVSNLDFSSPMRLARNPCLDPFETRLRYGHWWNNGMVSQVAFDQARNVVICGWTPSAYHGFS